MNSKHSVSHLEWSDVLRSARMPIHERVLDRLADLLFDSEEVLEMLTGEDAAKVRWIATDIRRVYEVVDGIMRKMAD